MAQHPSAQQSPFSVDPDDEVPVGTQVAWRLRALIVSGRLHPGDQLPGVRTLAQWADVNVNTVRGVYARLEDDGLIVTRHGRGSFVAGDPERNAKAEEIADRAIAEAEEAGIDPRDVAIIALVSASLPEPLPDELLVEPGDEPDVDALAAELDLDDSWLQTDEASARRELRRQIGRLEAQLAGYRKDLETREDEATPITPAAPRIASAAELERTRDELLHKLASARAAGAARARRERRAREVRDAIVADPSAHRWEVVSAAETGEEGCTTWKASPRLGPLGALMRWWQVKVSGGCPLARTQAPGDAR